MSNTTDKTENHDDVLSDSGILVVDDTPMNIQLVGAILERKGCRIFVANNGEQALQIADGKIHDLILLDISMPGMDGFETCSRLKQSVRTARIPIIFLSGHDKESDFTRGLEMGAVDYLIKPINPAKLVRLARTHLELKFNREKLERANCDRQEAIQALCAELAIPLEGIRRILDLVRSDPATLEKSLGELDSLVGTGLETLRKCREPEN